MRHSVGIAVHLHLAAVNVNGTGVTGVYAGKDLHHGGFSGAVLPHQSVNGALLQIEINAVQNGYAAEGFMHVFQTDDRVLLHIYHLTLYSESRFGSSTETPKGSRGILSGVSEHTMRHSYAGREWHM